MAVKWAVANGNWNAGATWNDGTIPTSSDDVYLNGHTITLPNSAYVPVAQSVSNGYCEQTGGSGGSITGGRQQTITLYNGTSLSAVVRYITANIICEGTPISTGGNHVRLVIFGNVLCNSQLTDNIANYHRGVHITGNVIANSYIVGNGTVPELIVTGNCDINYQPTYSTSAYYECIGVVNANVSFAENTIVANVINCRNNAVISGANATINGSITYESTNNTMGVRFTTLNILNPDTFTWKDITEPRVNPFIILTDAEMNNRQQYPSEDVVKEGVEYVWGEKVGTYPQPPESVVLKDYEYDTITAEENDIATYNLTRYIYADYGTLHWFELKTTTTDIVTTPSQQSITIGGETVVADTDYVVEYNDVCYQWSGSAWGSITTKNIGTVKTDIVTNPTETMLGVKKGTLETTNLSQQLISRLENCATVETVQQLLVAHLDN